MKKDVKSVVDIIAKEKNKELNKLEDELVILEKDLDVITQEADKIGEKIVEVEREISTLQENAESIRLVSSAYLVRCFMYSIPYRQRKRMHWRAIER